ncbi:MAG TPA: hypothetical protein PLQ13_04650, partial [Candidatus Krumholzibacteria bacterium]|nr:hypothetical protein [Candidatus Krumholzibacteria bacterium]
LAGSPHGADLGCHTEISAMRASGKGLHADPAFARCVDCHVEHQGEDFELVHWDGGREAFDHGKTGFGLEGSHAGKDCRTCHTTKYVVDPGVLRRAGKELDRTFLGLEPACKACHKDIHVGQFKQDCTSCHDTGKWKPAPRFDHAKTTYPLEGKHAQVDCAKCHKPAEAPKPTVFAGLAHANCTDCHRDPHAGALGPRCTDCHTTAGWKQIMGAGFDHERTRYPLRGKHRQVTCAKCHESRGAKPAFARCTDCHRDEHQGAARGRPGWTACDRCHTVDGYAPARFSLADHDTTAFRLEASHRAVPCGLCHKAAAAAAGQPALKGPDLAPPAQACTACHADPHRWQAGTPPACTTCHGQDTWRRATFDHAVTRFALTGRHATVACAGCHKPAPKPVVATLPDAPAFGGEPHFCADCHKDVHAGSMTRTAAEVERIDCARCHVTVDWLAENFVHDRDSRFTLAGAHAKVACAACHKAPAGERLVVFRPLAVECVACHPVLPSSGQEKR